MKSFEQMPGTPSSEGMPQEQPKKEEEKTKEGGKMEIKNPEVAERNWQKTIDRAINFLGTVSPLAIDPFEMKLFEDELKKGELKKLRGFERVLGKETMDYLVGIESNIPIAGALSDEAIKLSRKNREQEYARIRGLSREELLQEVKKYAVNRREEEKETKKR